MHTNVNKIPLFLLTSPSDLAPQKVNVFHNFSDIDRLRSEILLLNGGQHGEPSPLNWLG